MGACVGSHYITCLMNRYIVASIVSQNSITIIYTRGAIHVYHIKHQTSVFIMRLYA